MRYLAFFFVFFVFLLPVSGQSSKPKTTKPASAKPSATPAKKTAAAANKPAGKPEEKTDWEKISKVEDPNEKIAALAKFVSDFPKSEQLNEALTTLSTIRAELGNSKLIAGDATGAIPLLKSSAADAPKPVPDGLWNDLLSKIPANLYFRGARDEAYSVAASLEEKVDQNVARSLTLANFYLTVEDGSSARRVAERLIAADPNAAAAYQTLGLAHRIDFQLEESAAAYAKALELEPGSLNAKRGLAEAKRSLGKSDEAVVLYREILAKEEGDVPANTGLVLALFESGKRSDAEAELTKSLAANDSNVILLAGAAYWYAAHGEADKAVEYAQKAIAADPRYIWSHIALARGYLLQKKAALAEKTLFGAQRYGNFPTMQYEIAAARLAAGYYRDAANDMSQSFAVKDGIISVKLGGRVPREGKDLTELIGYERRASIFAAQAADDAETAARLAALLEFKQALEAEVPNTETASAAADKFVSGDDKMKVHRQLFAAGELLEKKIALPKVAELAKAASAGVDQGIDTPSAPTAVMAPAIYDIRAASAAEGQYVNVPEIPKTMMSAVLRGEIEMLTGWAEFQMEHPSEAVVRLKRAVSVLPADSSWWRTGMWRLGSALVGSGKEAEGLDAYIKAYKSVGVADPLKYSIIEGVYRRVNGSTDGLEAKIGPNPSPVVANKVEPSPEPTPVVENAKEKPAPSRPTPEVGIPASVPVAEAKVSEATPTPTPAVEPAPSQTPEPVASPTATPLATPDPSPSPTPEAAEEAKRPEATPTPEPIAKVKHPEPTPTPIVEKAPATVDTTAASPQTKPCVLTLSEESLVLPASGNERAIVVGSESEIELDDLNGKASSPGDIAITRQIVVGVRTKAMFTLRSTSGKKGTFSVLFEMPCGWKDISVTVKE